MTKVDPTFVRSGGSKEAVESAASHGDDPFMDYGSESKKIAVRSDPGVSEGWAVSPEEIGKPGSGAPTS